jgi:hypothetical protein
MMVIGEWFMVGYAANRAGDDHGIERLRDLAQLRDR